MNDFPRHPASNGPLFPDEDLRRLDAALHDAAANLPAPLGLERRVYDASMRVLPRRRLRLAGTTRAPIHTRLSGRMALAASLGMAFLVATWFMGVPLGSPAARLAESPSGASTMELVAERQVRMEYWGSLAESFNGDSTDIESYMAVASDLTLEDFYAEARQLTSDLEEM